MDAFVERLYDTLIGVRIPQDRVPGVENAFAPGSECERLYSQVMDAYERLRTRLGAEEEDPDVETVISSLMGIERIISFKMYQYGAEFGTAPRIIP